MAVYTRVSQAAVADHLAHYAIGALLSMQDIKAGVENSNYALKTTTGDYILTLIEKRVAPEDLPYILGLTRHLADQGLPVSAPVRTEDGALMIDLAHKPAVIAKRFPGQTLSTPSDRQAGDIGHMLARMHQAAKGFARKRPANLGLSAWHDLWHACRPNAGQVDPTLAPLIDAELAFLEDQWPSGLPFGPCHNDLFPDNVLASDSGLEGVIDFYFAADDAFAYDLAVTVNAWCFAPDGRLLKGHAKSLLERYDAARALTAGEDKALPILLRGAAMRFLLTRLYDWLHPVEGALVTPKDPSHFAAILRTHQKARDVSDYLL